MRFLNLFLLKFLQTFFRGDWYGDSYLIISGVPSEFFPMISSSILNRFPSRIILGIFPEFFLWEIKRSLRLPQDSFSDFFLDYFKDSFRDSRGSPRFLMDSSRDSFQDFLIFFSHWFWWFLHRFFYRTPPRSFHNFPSDFFSGILPEHLKELLSRY